MTFFQSNLPDSYRSVLNALYQGSVFLIQSNVTSNLLVAETLKLLCEKFQTKTLPLTSQYELSEGEFFDRIKFLRKFIYSQPFFHQLVSAVIESVGFDLSCSAFDPARIRVVQSHGHLNPAAKPIYHGHRDTWYSNSQSMITWWIPLQDVDRENSFCFFPSYFDKSVANDSDIFCFENWTKEGDEKRIGWQNRKTGLEEKYPRLLEAPEEQGVPVVCRKGDILLFSAQHLHQTTKNITGKTRFSLDFRTIDIQDHEMKVGAINVDNRSIGCSSKNFVKGIC